MVDKDQGRTVGQMKVRTLPAVRAGERGPRGAGRVRKCACMVGTAGHRAALCQERPWIPCRHAVTASPNALFCNCFSAKQTPRCTTC